MFPAFKTLKNKMMKTMKFTRGFFAFLFALGTFTFMACSPEDGAIGPQGEQGDIGPVGPQGEDGSVTAIVSNWIPSEFPETINDTFDQWSLFAPELTQEIHDSGIILIYARRGSLIYSVPNSFFSTIQENWNYRLLDINDTLIAIRVHSIDGSDIGAPFLNGDYRYVLIPNAQQSASKGNQPDYAKMSYEEIAAHFNIKD